MNLPMWKKMLVAVCVVGGTYGVVSGPALLAQKVESKTEAKSTAPEKKSYKRLPAYYGDLVDGTQKEKIYVLQEKWGKQIDALADQVKALQKQRDEEIEGVLTAEQKVKLEKTRAEAKAKAQEKAAAKKAAEEKEKAASGKPAEAPKPTATSTTKPVK
jgi:hypothetical protein